MKKAKPRMLQGCRRWELDGVLHRDDGPAIEWNFNSSLYAKYTQDFLLDLKNTLSDNWFLYGRQYTRSEYFNKLKEIGYDDIDIIDIALRYPD